MPGASLVFFTLKEPSGKVMLVLCVVCMCAHLVRPKRWTALLTALGFLIWLCSAWMYLLSGMSV